jgi:hypothetical protein
MTSGLVQVVMEMAYTHKVHVIAEYPTTEKAIDEYMKLLKGNKGSPVTPKGKYSVRKKPE